GQHRSHRRALQRAHGRERRAAPYLHRRERTQRAQPRHLKVGSKTYRTIWVASDGVSVEIIDQTKLPHDFVVEKLASLEDAARAFADMLVRGAPLMGVTAAYGLCLALKDDASDAAMHRAANVLEATRPTAVNLHAALHHMVERLQPIAPSERAAAAYALAS